MDLNQIYGAKIMDLALIVDNYMVISDLHLGYEQSLNADGIMVPKFQYPLIKARMEEIIKRSTCQRIIVNGDLKHEFGRISRQEWNEALNFLEFLEKHFKEIILIKGNHDNFTRFIAKKTDLEVLETFSLENFRIMHGHKIPSHLTRGEGETIIIGHEHPCIGLRSGERLEKIKCFLKTKYNGFNLIVMPSFNFVTEGSDILQERPLSPFLKGNPKKMEVIGVENFEIFPFGDIKNITAVKNDDNH